MPDNRRTTKRPLEAGWGFALVNSNEIQADNGAGHG